MACAPVNCSPLPEDYYYDNSTFVGFAPALAPNPDISGIGVVVGFVATAYLTFALLVFRYLMGFPEDSSLGSSDAKNPVDSAFLGLIWRTLPPPSKKWLPAIRTSILTMSDTQIATGIAILASGFSQIHCGLSMFHWQIVVYLAWFSSSTHLTTITFLRRFTHDNYGFRIVRIVLMLLLVFMLAVALVPTGGNCGLSPQAIWSLVQNSTDFPNGRRVQDDIYIYYPGFPVRCCIGLLGNKSFYKNTADDFLSMIASEMVLFFSSLSRCIKMFRGSSKFFKTWFREKPSLKFKGLLTILHQTGITGFTGLYYTGTLTLLFVRAVADLVESLVWEIMWLAFSLAWGTSRLLSTRNLASYDSASSPDSTSTVILQESFWGFGQWAPTMLLILPLISFAEPFFLVADIDNASTEVQQSSQSQVPVSLDQNLPLSQPTTPAPSLHEYDFYNEMWYNDLIAGILLIVVEYLILIIAFSLSDNTTTIDGIFDVFYPVHILLTIMWLYVYGGFCLYVQVHPGMLDKWLAYVPAKKRLLSYRVLRWFWISVLCIINSPLVDLY